MSKRVAEFDHFFGMKRARSLRSLARELKETTDIKKQDPLLYEGRVVTTPPLFALATELALKALYCQETKSNKVKATHDLIKLFEQLEENTQAELEATFEELGKNTHGRLVAEWPKPPSKIRHVLDENRGTFVSWRYPSRRSLTCYTGELDEVISTIIRIYEKRRQDSQLDIT
ncbi:MAG: HEPN domain-containing protein [Candidatus Dadabacteria bacterium]|nr:HEPN domain-containing protein [Candidatus Dadabacteria bacterium]